MVVLGTLFLALVVLIVGFAAVDVFISKFRRRGRDKCVYCGDSNDLRLSDTDTGHVRLMCVYCRYKQWHDQPKV